MPRIRLIHPEFWTDSRLTKRHKGARLTFVWLWNFADDAGDYPLDLSGITVGVFPHDKEETESTVGLYLLELVKADFRIIPYYGEDGQLYLCIRNFLKHQSVRYPSKAQYPLPPFILESVKVTKERTTYPHTLDTKRLAAYLHTDVEQAVRDMCIICDSQVSVMFPGYCTESIKPKALSMVHSTVSGTGSPVDNSSLASPDKPPKPLVLGSTKTRYPSCFDLRENSERIVSNVGDLLGRPLKPHEATEIDSLLCDHCVDAANADYCWDNPTKQQATARLVHVQPVCFNLVAKTLANFDAAVKREHEKNSEVVKPHALFGRIWRDEREKMLSYLRDAGLRARGRL